MTTQAAQSSRAGMLPKLTIAPTMLLIVFIVKALFAVLWDPDIYWHLKIGEFIATHGALPPGELFTYTHPGAPLNHSEWLFQTILYLVYRPFGFAGVTVMVAALYTACWYVTLLNCRKVFDDEGKAVVITMLFCAVMCVVAARPQVITFLFLPLTLHLAIDFKYANGLRKLWLLPPLMVVWVNAHGGFFLGLVLIWAFTLSEWAMHLWRGSDPPAQRRRLGTLALVAVVSTLATLANPGFLDGWWYPLRVIWGSPDTAFVAEWQSPNFHDGLATQYFLLTVFLFFVAAARSARRPDLTELGIPLIFVAGAFYSLRNIPYAGFAMAPFFALFARSMLSREQTPPAGGVAVGTASPTALRIRAFVARGNRDLGEQGTGLNWLLVAATLVALVLVYPSHTKTMAGEMEKLLPVKATDFVIREGITGRMFNTYHTGGYLIFRLPPSEKVFIYPRTDFYRPGFLKEYSTIYNGGPGWKALFDKYAIDFVICEHIAPLRQLLLEGQEYRLVFDDGRHAVLVRNSDRFRSLIAKYGATPASE